MAVSQRRTSGLCCHGQRPFSSTSRLNLRNVRMATMIARTPALSNDGVTATVR